MKKKIVNTITLLWLIISCDPLDVEPTDLIPDEDAITDLKGLNAAVVGVYDGLQRTDISQHYMTFGDLSADNMEAVGSRIAYRQVADNRINPNNIRMEGIWNAHYDVINRVNTVLDNIDNVEGVSQEQINRKRGEVLFIRALCHFNLVRVFGPIPIKTSATSGITPEDLNIPRSSVTDVYNQIIEDLDNAHAFLESTGKGVSSLVSDGAVLSLLARVYLHQGDFEKVEEFTGEVMNLGYELVPGEEYELIFDESSENDEIIFQIDYSDDDVNSLADYYLPSARFEVGLTEEAYNLFSADDFRAEIAAPAGSSDLFCDKYTDIAIDSDNSIVLRYTDILLMRAEALNELAYVEDGEAFNLLNLVRLRAGIPALNSNDLVNQDQFRQAIATERRKEFLGEGHRWHDLKRTGRALEVLTFLESEDQLLYPIPQSEIDTNESEQMTQNDGY